jgi:hypothetical protein
MPRLNGLPIAPLSRAVTSMEGTEVDFFTTPAEQGKSRAFGTKTRRV